jgi:Cytochrome bd terminal oxidase subunit I
MKLDPSILARIQFAFTVSFHIIFPTMSIGLASFLAVIEALWLKTKNPTYLQIYRFWLNIFAMGFGIGVVTGIVLSFEFGLGFARFAQMAGPAIGPLIALEVLTAFFLEAGFLGIMLFGFDRVGPKLHFVATCMVALGTLLSASWILSANSWMQTPAGVAIHDGQLTVVNWLHVLMNPSWPYRLPHMLTAAYLTAAFMVAGVGAWYLLRGKHQDFARKTVALGTAFATVLIAGQVFIGDLVPTVKDAGGRGLLGKAITIAGTVLLVHNSGPTESAKSVRVGNTPSRKYLAHPQPQGTCRRSDKYTTRAPAQNGTRIFCISNHVLSGDAHVRRGSRFTLVAIPWDALQV